LSSSLQEVEELACTLTNITAAVRSGKAGHVQENTAGSSAEVERSHVESSLVSVPEMPRAKQGTSYENRRSPDAAGRMTQPRVAQQTRDAISQCDAIFWSSEVCVNR
jgi:hypothetical protein